jgi:flagellar basal-body rod protein FlgF
MILEMTRPVQGGLRQERKLEAVSNNLANVDTTGFKKDSISFDDTFKARLNKDFSQGNIIRTGNPFDVALSGQGFFKIETAEGIRYSRNGNFNLDSNGILVDQNGNPVMGQGGAIAINSDNPELDLGINQAGEISIGGEIVDTLDLVTFNDLTKIKRDGQNLLSFEGETTQEIQAALVVVEHKSLEKGNVSAVDEMVKMIDYHRMFETFTKSMMTFDELDNKAINDVGKLI